MKKIFLIFILLFFFFAFAGFYLSKPNQKKIDNDLQENASNLSIISTSTASVTQPTIAQATETKIAIANTKTQPKPDCSELANQFIERKGYKISGLTFHSYFNSNPKLGCLLAVALVTPWHNGMLNVDWYSYLFNLSDNSMISTFHGHGEDPGDTPDVIDCEIYGTQKYTCKSFAEYNAFVDNILSQ